jgi:hypothetical protein
MSKKIENEKKVAIKILNKYHKKIKILVMQINTFYY